MKKEIIDLEKQEVLKEIAQETGMPEPVATLYFEVVKLHVLTIVNNNLANGINKEIVLKVMELACRELLHVINM